MPTAAGSFQGIVKAALGFYHSLVIKADGTAWAVGANGDGALGDGTTVDRTDAVPVVGVSGP